MVIFDWHRILVTLIACQCLQSKVHMYHLLSSHQLDVRNRSLLRLGCTWLQRRYSPCKATRMLTRYHAMSSEAKTAAAESVKSIDMMRFAAESYQNSGKSRILSKIPATTVTSLLLRQQVCNAGRASRRLYPQTVVKLRLGRVEESVRGPQLHASERTSAVRRAGLCIIL
jgi:hypothetical protein